MDTRRGETEDPAFDGPVRCRSPMSCDGRNDEAEGAQHYPQRVNSGDGSPSTPRSQHSKQQSENGDYPNQPRSKSSGPGSTGSVHGQNPLSIDTDPDSDAVPASSASRSGAVVASSQAGHESQQHPQQHQKQLSEPHASHVHIQATSAIPPRVYASESTELNGQDVPKREEPTAPQAPVPPPQGDQNPVGVLTSDPDEDPDDDPNEEPSILPFVYLPASKIYQPIWWQCGAFVLLFLGVMFFMCMLLTVTTWRYPDPRTQKQLPDIGLDNLPRVRELEHVTDVFMYTLVGFCLFLVPTLHLVSVGKLKCQDRKRLARFQPLDHLAACAWIRFFVLYTAVSALRVIIVGATVLPATNNQCRTRPDTGSFWWNSLLGVMTFGSGSVHCGDLLFSGHTAVVTLSLMMVCEYGPIVWRPFPYIASVLTVGTWFTILMSRSHYTDDIIVAFYIVVTLFKLTPHDPVHGAPAIYHLFIQSPHRVVRAILEARAERRERRARILANKTSASPTVVVQY